MLAFFSLQEAYHHCLLPHQRSEFSNANTHNAAVVVKLLNHQDPADLRKISNQVTAGIVCFCHNVKQERFYIIV